MHDIILGQIILEIRTAANGVVFFIGYGLTETAPVISATPLRLSSAKTGSAGIIVANTELKVCWSCSVYC